MKKIIFTVAQLLLLQEVRGTIGYSSEVMLDLLDENKDPKDDVEFELSEEDIEDIADSIQWHIELEEIPDEDLAITNEILELLGVLPEDAEETTETDTDIDKYQGADKD